MEDHRDERGDELRRHGFAQVLQVHDEIILEGPTQHAEAALHRVKHIMANPLPYPLLIDLVVDANIGQNWNDAK